MWFANELHNYGQSYVAVLLNHVCHVGRLHGVKLLCGGLHNVFVYLAVYLSFEQSEN